jgi:hypothetical protein
MILSYDAIGRMEFSERTIGKIALNDAMILSYDASPSRMEFSGKDNTLIEIACLSKHRFIMPIPIALYDLFGIVFLFHSQKFRELRIAR